MKSNPLETRSALHDRFPRWTQPVLTWITGIAMPGHRPVWRWSMRMHLAALGIAWLATLCLGVTVAETLMGVTPIA